MDNTENIISFCTGYGGLELGLRGVIPNLRTVAYVEIEAFACTNLVAKMEENKLDAAPIWTDIKTFPSPWFHGKVHGIVGGYPCQPFSHAGKRQGSDDERHLWPYIEKHIRTIRPIWCFFENVSGHLSLGFQEVFTSLRDLGYSVEAGLFTAAEVGAPHKRQRLFILAYRTDGSMGNSSIVEPAKIKAGERNIQQRSEFDGASELEISSGIGRGRRSDGEPGGQGRPLQIEGSGELANSESRAGQIHTGPGSEGSGEIIAGRAGDELENATSRGRHQRIKTQDRPQKENGKSSASFSKPSNGELADSNVSGCKEQCGPEPIRPKHPALKCPSVARPGQPQYEWEEPRTVKSGMGRTVNGFNSRVDELRLLGNGVVPACAELAFRSLYAKIIYNRRFKEIAK